MKIEELRLSTRTYNCLKRKGIDTIEQLTRIPEKELMKIRGFGAECLKEVQEKMDTHKDHIPEKLLQEMKPDPVAEPITIVTRREKQAVYLPEEFGHAIDVLKEEYEKTRNNPYIQNPIAWALYHTWRRIDSRRN